MAELPVGDAWKKGTEDDISFMHNCFCPACHGGKALTTMLPTKVPMFREIIIMNLVCSVSISLFALFFFTLRSASYIC